MKAKTEALPSVNFPGSGVGPGSILGGKYQVLGVLGQGGMGMVVAATHLQLDQKVAVKMLLPEALRNADIVARFAREARATVKIQSEHVVKVLDVGSLESGAPYMVMEYLDGKDLAAILQQRGTIPLGEAVDYVLQACEALAEAHRAGVVHRDLKPANLFLTSRADGSAVVKVLDFGISKASLASGTSQASLTQTSAVMGSPNYMSPEQLRNSKTVDARTDIWSLGLVLYELLTGQVAFQAETLAELHVAILQNLPSPLREKRPDLPPSLEILILRCLHKDPGFRFANVAELAQALGEFAYPRSFVSIERVCRVLGVPLTIQAPSGLQPPASQLPPSSFQPGSQVPPTAASPSYSTAGQPASAAGSPGRSPSASTHAGWAPPASQAGGAGAGWPQAPQPIVPAPPSYAHNAQPWGTGPMYPQAMAVQPKSSGPSTMAIVGLIALVFCVVTFSGCVLCVLLGSVGHHR